jgi:hypothetical protein
MTTIEELEKKVVYLQHTVDLLDRMVQQEIANINVLTENQSVLIVKSNITMRSLNILKPIVADFYSRRDAEKYCEVIYQ